MPDFGGNLELHLKALIFFRSSFIVLGFVFMGFLSSGFFCFVWVGVTFLI